MALTFLKKKEEKYGKGFVPTERVRELLSKGFMEHEIVDTLRKEGFSAEEIDKALTEALRDRVEKKEELPTIEDIKPKKEDKESVEVFEPQAPEEMLHSYPAEEYITALVQARVSEVEDKIRMIESKYLELSKRIEMLNRNLDEILRSGKEEKQEILKRIEDFGERLEEIGAKIGGLERAFKETLPALIDGVRGLVSLVENLKKK